MARRASDPPDRQADAVLLKTLSDKDTSDKGVCQDERFSSILALGNPAACPQGVITWRTPTEYRFFSGAVFSP